MPQRKSGLLRRCAPRNDANSKKPLAARCARVVQEPPSKNEGAGNAGCALHPRSRVQKVVESAHTSIQVQRRQSGIPCAMALRLMPRSPRRRIRLVTVVGEYGWSKPGWADFASANLTPATGARTTRFYRTQQHRSSARCDRSRAFPQWITRPAILSRARRCRVHRIPSRVRDDHDTPLCG